MFYLLISHISIGFLSSLGPFALLLPLLLAQITDFHMFGNSVESHSGLTLFQFTELVVQSEHHEMEEHKNYRDGTAKNPSCNRNRIVLIAKWFIGLEHKVKVKNGGYGLHEGIREDKGEIERHELPIGKYSDFLELTSPLVYVPKSVSREESDQP